MAAEGLSDFIKLGMAS